ncbi:MAG TPA: M23 family metallopeptidase, partial [Herpetosiphonaceae bacterium]
VSGRFLAYWEANGGLEAFGYPLSAPVREQNPDDRRWYEVQHFERARFELHPANQPPFDVLLGRLGVDRLAARGVRWQSLPKTRVTGPGCRRFAETGHQICGRIRETWERHGLAIYGLPISDLLRETSADGEPQIVQYFERARFELHPANQPPFDVLLGQLERERITGTGPIGRPVPQPPYVFPVQPADRVTYGREHHDYPATDMFTPQGSDFVAPTSGVVEFVSREDRWSPQTDRGEDRGGLSVSLVGDDGIRYYGSHLSAIAAGIEVGARVEAGQLLGKTGNTGSARPTPPHLHFGISRPTRADDWAIRRGEINPYPFVKQWQRGMPLRPAVPWLP